MRTSEVLHILDALERVGVRYWLGGGWGVDALHGGATREHRDLDLAIDADTFGMARGTLEAMGFSAETDWLPVRLEMAGGPGGWVDLHPVRFDSDGDGVQQGLDGATFVYPAAELVVGASQAGMCPASRSGCSASFTLGTTRDRRTCTTSASSIASRPDTVDLTAPGNILICRVEDGHARPVLPPVATR